MEDKPVEKIEETLKEVPNYLSPEELLQRQYDKELREERISRTRAGVVRSQILRAYEILEDIRFDHIGDTAFRDKVTKAKQGLEQAISDFLLRDEYWEGRIKIHRDMTPKEYDEYLKGPVFQDAESPEQS